MIRETRNMDIVNSILTIPEIWKDIAPEGIDAFDMPYDSDFLYYMANDSDGVIIFHPYRDGLKIHPNFIPDRRGKAAYRAIDESIQSVFERGVTSVYAEINRNLKHVIRCAKALGFSLLESGERDLLVRYKLDA